MKTNKFIKRCGPYEVHSISQDMHGIRLVVYPAFPQYNISEKRRTEKDVDPSWTKEPRWSLHRYKGEGGGPSIFTTMALAREFEKFLNQPYSEDEVKEWKATLDKALKKVRLQETKRVEKVFAKAEKASL